MKPNGKEDFTGGAETRRSEEEQRVISSLASSDLRVSASPVLPSAVSLLAAALLMLIVGCAVGPDYRQSATVADTAAWVTPQPTGVAIPIARWWTVYGDDGLARLVDEALTSGLDVRVASARLREARAAVGLSEAPLLPYGNASGGVTRDRASANRRGGGARPQYTTTWTAGLDATWEIDLFGGNRREVEATVAELGAVAADLGAVRSSVAAEVALAWIDLTSANQRLGLAERTIVNQQADHRLATVRFDAGLVAASDLAEADAQIAQTAAQLPAIIAAQSQARVRLAVLLGRPPQQAAALPAAPAVLPRPRELLELGLPSDLLRRRPDIVRAERELAAATARIGVATADWFPRFSLMGAFGYESTGGGKFVSRPNQFWSIGPAIRWPILSAWGIAANVRAANAGTERAALHYERTVLAALGEVENAVVAVLSEQDRGQQLDLALAAQERSLGFARVRFERGLDAYDTVLRAERLLISVHDQVVLSRRAVCQGLAALAKALGGGWNAEPIAAK